MSRFSGPGPYFEDAAPAGWEGASLPPRARLRAVKRREVEERNAKTPAERRRAYRRLPALAAAQATASKKRGRKPAA